MPRRLLILAHFGWDSIYFLEVQRKPGKPACVHITIDVNIIPATSSVGQSRGTQALKPAVIDKDGPILRGAPGGPQVIGSFHGFPLYRDGTILLTRNSQPIRVPVSREQYLRAMIADYQAKAQNQGSGYSARFAAPLETALASMRSSERALQAWIGCRGPATLCSSNDPLLKDAAPVERVNRNFFDPKPSPDAIQLLTIRMARNLDPYAQYIFQRIWDTLDWNAISNMLAVASPR